MLRMGIQGYAAQPFQTRPPLVALGRSALAVMVYGRSRGRRGAAGMADVFVSYARKDKALVAPLVAVLEAEGWS